MDPSLDSAVTTLLATPTTVRLSPLAEGNNISFAIGFKHINYLAERAVQHHFRASGLPSVDLYRRFGLGFEVVDIRSRLGALVALDDELVAEVVPVTKDAEDSLRFRVSLVVERDGAPVTCAESTVRVALRVDEHIAAEEQWPAGIEPFVATRLGTGEQVETATPLADYGPLAAGRAHGRGSDEDPVLRELIGETNAFGWHWRIPYFYCHFNERVQMSGYLRIMEETQDLFLADRGLSIKRVLDSKGWIPVVTTSRIELLDETLMEETLYTVYTVENIFKSLLYTSRMDCYVARDGFLVRTATGTITHGYLYEHAPNQWQMAELDDATLSALTTPRKAGA